MTSNGRWPENIKSGLSRQPLMDHNFKLKLRWSNHILQILKQRQPPMRDDIKILKVEYLRNHLWDEYFTHKLIRPNYILQILQMKTPSNGRWPPMEDYKSYKWRWPPIEDDLKILKVEYFGNHSLDHTQISKLTLEVQSIFYKSLKWWWPPLKDNLKILKLEYISYHLLDLIILRF
jgi:hypothetical protein